MPRVESQETVPCAAGACQSKEKHALPVAGTMSVMTAGTASVLRFAAMLLAAFLLGVPSAWGALALWYQAPGSLLKRLIVLLWSAFALGVVIALWQGHAAPAFLSFALAFGVLLIWWQRITPTNERL